MSDRADEIAKQVVYDVWETWPGDCTSTEPGEPANVVEHMTVRFAAALRAYAEEARREEPWTLVSDAHPHPHARYEVRRPATGPFVGTPCYGMHEPWWVPLTVDLYAPGALAFPMESGDEWRPWAAAIRAREETS